MKDVYGLVKKNVVLHTILEQEVTRMQYGQINVDFELKDGVADLKTLNIVRTKRNRY